MAKNETVFFNKQPSLEFIFFYFSAWENFQSLTILFPCVNKTIFIAENVRLTLLRRVLSSTLEYPVKQDTLENNNNLFLIPKRSILQIRLKSEKIPSTERCPWFKVCDGMGLSKKPDSSLKKFFCSNDNLVRTPHTFKSV